VSDERNFHCWNYRKVVAEFAKKTKKEELNFAQELIDINFSNFSAWHLKLKILDTMQISAQQISEEFDIVNNALFTEPDDQSVWMVYRWLVKMHLKEYPVLIEAQLDLCMELDELEGNNNKWVLLAMSDLMQLQKKKHPGIFRRLLELDPGHGAFYLHMLYKN